MKGKKILSALQYVDPELIEEAMADPVITGTKGSRFRFSTLIAACLCLVCSITALWYMAQWRSPGEATGEETLITAPSTETPSGEAPIEGVETGEPVSDDTNTKVVVIGLPVMTGYDLELRLTCGEWCDIWGMEFSYYPTPNISLENYEYTVQEAVEEGANILVFTSDVFAEAIAVTAETYPEVYFIGLNMDETNFAPDYVLPKNVHISSFQVEDAGFLAGFASVSLGYTKLGFVGMAEDPMDQSYKAGFMQGVDYAAGLQETPVELKVMDCESTDDYGVVCAHMERWIDDGTEAIFICSGELSYNVTESIVNAGAKLISDPWENEPRYEITYEDGTVLTTTVQKIGDLAWFLLDNTYGEGWNALGGTYLKWGVRNTWDLCDIEDSYVGLSDDTMFGEGFTPQDYNDLLKDLRSGNILISYLWEEGVETKNITVDYRSSADDPAPTEPETEPYTEKSSYSGGGK